MVALLKSVLTRIIHSDAAGVFEHCDVSDIVVSVFHGPVVAYGLRRFFRADWGGAEIERDVFAAVPIF